MKWNRINTIKIAATAAAAKEYKQNIHTKTCLQLQISVCHVIKVNRGVLRVKTFEMGEKEKIRIEYEFVMINVKSFNFSAHIWFLAN